MDADASRDARGDREATVSRWALEESWRLGYTLYSLIPDYWINGMPEQAHLNRLFWHSRRGMRELDLLLVPFVREAYPALVPEDQLRYEAFLKMEDQDMFNLLMERVKATEPDLQRIIRLILEHAAQNAQNPAG